MPAISRRVVLAAGLTLLLPASRAAAASTPTPVPIVPKAPVPPLPGSHLTASSKQVGDVLVSVEADSHQDVTAVHITLQNQGAAADVVTLTCVDMLGNAVVRNGPPRSVAVPAGTTVEVTLYNHLTHALRVDACVSSGQCGQIAPIRRQYGGPVPRRRTGHPLRIRPFPQLSPNVRSALASPVGANA